MNSTDLLDQFRLDCADQEDPPLWVDAEIYGYADDAQKMFARLTGGFGDASSALTTLSYVTTTDWVALSPLVLTIRSARHALTGAPVEIVNYENFTNLGLRLDGAAGLPKMMIIGLEQDKVRLYPYPNVAGAIQIIVDRLPLKPINDADQKLEAPDQHKTGLGLWMKARAYDKQDAETFDRGKAAGFKQEFYAYCAAAKTEKDRVKHKPRIMSYGGI